MKQLVGSTGLRLNIDLINKLASIMSHKPNNNIRATGTRINIMQ